MDWLWDLISGGLSAAGGALRAQANASTYDAGKRADYEAFNRSKAARTAEIGRQSAFETQSDATVHNALGEMGRDDYDAGLAQKSSAFMSAMDENAPPTLKMPGANKVSPAVAQAIAREAAKAAQKARGRVASLGKLSSADSVAMDRGTTLAESADKLATIGSYRRGSLGVSQGEQSLPAATVIPADTTLADILSGTGGIISDLNKPSYSGRWGWSDLGYGGP